MYREANRKPQKVFPLSKMAENLKMYPFTLSRLPGGKVVRIPESPEFPEEKKVEKNNKHVSSFYSVNYNY